MKADDLKITKELLIMPNVLVRDVETSVLEKIKENARRGGLSLQRQMQIILAEAAEKSIEPLSELETARKIRRFLAAREQSDSAELLRADRRR